MILRVLFLLMFMTEIRNVLKRWKEPLYIFTNDKQLKIKNSSDLLNLNNITKAFLYNGALSTYQGEDLRILSLSGLRKVEKAQFVEEIMKYIKPNDTNEL